MEFEIKRNQIIALVGPNRSGKSTVVDIMSLDIPASSGGIFLDKTSYSTYDCSKLG